MKKSTYTAQFSDGSIVTRQSARDYSHAWRSQFTDSRGTAFAPVGFSASAPLAHRAAAAASGRHNCLVEVVPVERDNPHTIAQAKAQAAARKAAQAGAA